MKDIQVTTRDEAIKAFISVLQGTANKSMIDITALNAAAGLIVNGISDTFDEALQITFDAITSGKSFELFKNFIKYCGDIGKIEEFEKI